MTDSILRILSIGVIAFSLLSGATILIGASFYDIKWARQRRQTAGKAPKRRSMPRPLVSAIVYSRNEASRTLICLESLIKSRHRKLEIIVINNGSSDDTKAALKEFVSQHPKRAIRVINKRGPASTVEKAVKSGLRASRGDILLFLTADSGLMPQTFGQVADKFGGGLTKALIPRTTVEPYSAALNLWLSFKNLLRTNWQKTASLTGPTGSGLHFGVFYSRPMVKNRSRCQSYSYDSSVILVRRPNLSIVSPRLVYHEPAVLTKSVKKSALGPVISFISFVYLVIALPVFAWYGLYLALNRGYSYLLLLAWGIFTFIYLFVVWTDEHLGAKTKAGLSALVPAVFSLAVIMVFVEALARLARLINPKLKSPAAKV